MSPVAQDLMSAGGERRHGQLSVRSCNEDRALARRHCHTGFPTDFHHFAEARQLRGSAYGGSANALLMRAQSSDCSCSAEPMADKTAWIETG